MIKQAIIAAVGLMFCGVATAQTEDCAEKEGTTIELPRFAVTTVTTVVHVPDGGMTHWEARRNRKPRTSRQLLASEKLPTYLQSHVCSKVVAEGKTVYDIVHEYKPLEIVVYDHGKIEMTIVRHYDDSNRDDLVSDHPEIGMHINAFPSESPGNGSVKISLDIATTIAVDDLEQLESVHPNLHKIFQLYHKP